MQFLSFQKIPGFLSHAFARHSTQKVLSHSRMLSSKAFPLLTACLNYAKLILPSLYPSFGFWDAFASWLFFFANGHFFLPSFAISTSYSDLEPRVLTKSALKPLFFPSEFCYSLERA